jgi:hypothetical protein
LWFFCHRVVKHVNCDFKLRNLTCKHLIALSITNTISVNNKVCWILTFMVFCKKFNCLHNRVLHIVLDNLLPFLLDQKITIVLGHFSIVRGWKTYNWLGTCMTNVDTNQHCTLLQKCIWEFKMIKVATNFTVHLSQDISSFWETELLAITCSDNLWGHSILKHDFLKHFVVILTLKNADHNQRMVKLLVTHHVLS